MTHLNDFDRTNSRAYGLATDPLEDTTMRRRKLLLAGAKYLFAGGMIASAFAFTSPVVHADGMAPRVSRSRGTH